MKCAFTVAALAVIGLGADMVRLKPDATLLAQQPTFRGGVTLVNTDAIPRDDKGRFVSDLTRENFTVFEDGVPQVVTSFSLVQGAGRSTC